MSPTSRRGGRGRPRRTAPAAARPAAPTSDVHDPAGERLQKVLASAGVASRRRAEQLIAAGRVSVDGQVVTELGTRVATGAVIHVDGMRVQTDETKTYLAVNKPVGMVSTMSDEQGRPCLGDLVADRGDRLFHVGRLDVDSEGLLLLTNDGELAHRLQHPSHGVPKWYLAEVPGPVGRDVGRRLKEGVELDDGPVAVDSFTVVDSAPGKALLEVVIHEGRKHVVRRMLEAVGHPVERLVRTRIGSVRLGELPAGRTRTLSEGEVAGLFRDVGL
ncbi:pseudouridine synthase [Aquipuribacter nitratireducens]|uniref:Pseudouridine synthase n=1 Tax=Aquipuribacter nitratireducens TaxID=650104 RepID=A0ABW0GR39_9MICO